MSVEIKPVLESDIGALSEFSAKTFCDTFAHLYPKEDLDYFLNTKHSEQYYREFLADSGNFARIAVKDGNILGYVTSGPIGLPIEHKDGAYEMYRLYIDVDAKGAGLGKTLYELSLNEARKLGASEFYLGVYSDNIAAQKFYFKLGFEIVGQYFFPVGNTQDDERIMRLNPKVFAQ